MSKRRIGLIVGMVVVLLAAAGCQDKGGEATPVPTQPLETPTETPVPPTPTPPTPPTPLPPTWTPVPTLTQPPRATFQYTYERPTATSFTLPTYTPSVEPPTPTPPGPVLMITADMLNQAVRTTLESGSGGLFDAPPNIGFQEGVMLVSLNVLTTPGDLGTARSVVIQAQVTQEQGRVTLTKIGANFTDTNAIYEDPLIDNLLGTIEDAIGSMVNELYAAANPDGGAFYVSDILIASLGMTIQTVKVG